MIGIMTSKTLTWRIWLKHSENSNLVNQGNIFPLVYFLFIYIVWNIPMSNISKSIFFNLSKDGSFQTLIRPYCNASELTSIVDSGIFDYLCDIHRDKRRFWYFISEGGLTTHTPESEIPKELLAFILLM